MIQFESEKVFIEHCHHCSTHSWCTNHDESKYSSYFNTLKEKIADLCPEIQVISNQIPVSLTSKFTTSESKPWEGKHSFPRIGSFEVYFRSKTVFSKLETGHWPQAAIIASKVHEMMTKPSLPQIVKEPARGKSKTRESKSMRSSKKRYKSTTPSRKAQKKLEISANNLKESEYDDDKFEEDPEVKVTKVYDLVLPCGTVSNKKINYVNKGDQVCEFKLTSSDPSGMAVKEDFVTIEPGMIGKFQLRFAAQKVDEEKEFMLTVENKGSVWESFKFRVKYQ